MTRCEPPRRSRPRLMFWRRMLLSPASEKSAAVGLWPGQSMAARPRSVTSTMMTKRVRRFFFMTKTVFGFQFLVEAEPLKTETCLLLSLLLALHPGDGASGDFEERLVCAHDEQRLLLDLLDGGVDAARRDDAVARLERRNHLLPSLLTAPLRDDYQEVEDAEDEQEWGERAENAPAAAALKD